MKRSAEIAQEQTDELKEELKTLKKRNETIHRAEIENKDAANRLSLENERLRKEIKENQIPEELMHECYCMAYDKEAGAQKKMEQAADQMAEAAIKGEDTQSFAKEYQAQKSNRRRYEKIMQQLDKIEKRKAGREWQEQRKAASEGVRSVDTTLIGKTCGTRQTQTGSGADWSAGTATIRSW